MVPAVVEASETENTPTGQRPPDSPLPSHPMPHLRAQLHGTYATRTVSRSSGWPTRPGTDRFAPRARTGGCAFGGMIERTVRLARNDCVGRDALRSKAVTSHRTPRRTLPPRSGVILWSAATCRSFGLGCGSALRLGPGPPLMALVVVCFVSVSEVPPAPLPLLRLPHDEIREVRAGAA